MFPHSDEHVSQAPQPQAACPDIGTYVSAKFCIAYKVSG
jgi:hypothetical protein